MAESLKYTPHQYGSENELQKLGVWELDPTNESKYWVVYVHGGAWRDPRVEHPTFGTSITRILESTNSAAAAAKSSIAGFASIDYRLSPHPDFPQDLATTPSKQQRVASHPNHVDDVRSGIAFLQKLYGFGPRYVLVGHSAGATMALQILGGLHGDNCAIELPRAMVPFEGIYDFNALNKRMGGNYGGFFSAAFGDDQGAWDQSAPMLAGKYDKKDSLVLLAWSDEDELVDRPEVDGMEERLRKDGFGEDELVVWKDLKGTHQEIWQKGDEIARMVLWVLERIRN